MKKTIISAAAVLCTAFGAFAQNAAQTQAAPQSGMHQMQARTISPDDRAKRMTDQMKDALQLTPEQYNKVLDVNKKFATKQEAMRTASQSQTQPATPSDRMAQMKAMNEEKDTQLKAILTPEQLQKLQDMHRMPHQGMGNMRSANGQMQQQSAPAQQH